MSALHITNGDCAADTLREFIHDPIVIAADVLHDGPAPAVGDERWYELRARFLAQSPERVAALQQELAASDRRLDAPPSTARSYSGSSTICSISST